MLLADPVQPSISVDGVGTRIIILELTVVHQINCADEMQCLEPAGTWFPNVRVS